VPVLPYALTGLLFAILFAQPFTSLVRDWWLLPEAGHGLLLGPLAIWLAWRAGLDPARQEQPLWGAVILLGAVSLRFLSALAAELFTLRQSMIVAAAGLVVAYGGFPQLRRWWLSLAILVLAVPLPAIVTNTLSLPLQFKASTIGAALLAWRDVPVELSGNIILLPGHQLFVTEACSGLRSLTALFSLGVLVGGLWLRRPPSRLLVLGLTVPIALLINAVRIFLTGFLVFFVDPKLGDGFMHLTEGWLMFVMALLLLGACAHGLAALERRSRP
jgi:exosortase